MVAATLAPQLAGYRDLTPLGRGGYSEVFRAYQERFDRWVAVKVLTFPLADGAVQRRFLRECQLAGRVSAHPHIVSVLDAGLGPDGHPYIALELYDGGSLADRLAAGGAMDVAAALRTAVALAGALETAHRAGVVHRDVKPGNVLLTGYGQPALADFGLSVIAEHHEVSTGLDALSPYHAPPEVLEGVLPNAVSDVYSLASTTYTMLAGRPPHRLEPGEAPAALLARIIRAEVPPLRRADMPGSLEAALRAALARDPSVRTPTALAFAEALRQAQADLGLEPTDPIVLDPPALPASPSSPSAEPAGTRLSPGVPSPASPSSPSAAPMASRGVPAPVPPSSPSAEPAGAQLPPEAADGRVPAGNPLPASGDAVTGPVAAVGGGAGDETVHRSRIPGPWPPEPERGGPARKPRRRAALVAAGLLGIAAVGGAAGLVVTGGGGEAAGPAAPSSTTETTAPPGSTATTAPTTTAPPPPADLAVADVSASATAPDSTDGCGETTNYGAANAVDGANDTGWSVVGDATGETLTLTLDGERQVQSVGLLPGYAKVDACTGVDRFPENRRPTSVTWRFDDGTEVTQELDDAPEMQAVEVDAATETIELTIDGVTGDPRRDFTVISEVAVQGN